MNDNQITALVHKTVRKLEAREDVASGNYAVILTMLLLFRSDPSQEAIEEYIQQLIKMISNETDS